VVEGGKGGVCAVVAGVVASVSVSAMVVRRSSSWTNQLSDHSRVSRPLSTRTHTHTRAPTPTPTCTRAHVRNILRRPAL
jgi:hypothetical protein